jgi:hypothetical protein
LSCERQAAAKFERMDFEARKLAFLIPAPQFTCCHLRLGILFICVLMFNKNLLEQFLCHLKSMAGFSFVEGEIQG